MTLACLVSAHGAPGVTTTTLVLAATWPGGGQRLVVEADPFGGVIAARFGLADTPGLVSLAAEARGDLDSELVWRHAQGLPGGLAVLVAPPSADQANAVLRDLASSLAGWAASGDVEVFADCGRIGISPPQRPLLAAAARLLVLCRPTVDQLRPAADRTRSLQGAGVKAKLLLVGDMPYGAQEVGATLGVEVAGTVAWDPHTADAVNGFKGSGGGHDRSVLVRSATTLATSLAASDSLGVGQ